MKGFRTLDRYVIREVSGPFVFGVLAFTLIMVAGGLLFKLADLIIEQGVPFSVALRLFFYQLPSVVTLTLPMSCLLGALLGFGKLAAGSEVVALKAAGLSFGRILRPLIFASLLISFLALGINETLVPLGQQAARNLTAKELVAARPALLQEKVFIKTPGAEGNRILYIEKLDSKEGLMSGVVVQEFDKNRLARVTTAPQARWEKGRWTLFDGQVYQFDREGGVSNLLNFSSQDLRLVLTPRQLSRSTADPDEMSFQELRGYIKVMEAQSRPVASLWVVYYLKFALPFSCVILALLGATLGARGGRRHGTSMGFGQSILLVFLYYLIMTLGRSMGGAGVIPPALAAWLPNLLFAAGVLVLVRRAN